MQCLNPLDGWYSRRVNPSGKRSVVFDVKEGFIDRPVRVPCGSCVHCVMEYRRQWAVRVYHESQLYRANCMITVTYDDANLPWASSLCREDLQKFVKRLRKEVGDVRVFYCGEYGDSGGRPHYHAILFGYDFADKEYVASRNGLPVFRSALLQRLWSKGRTEVGTVTLAGASYVAGYVAHKLEALERNPLQDRPFVGMSLKPGIGFWWFMRYYREVYPVDRVVIEGREQSPPRAYDRWLAALRPRLWRRVKRAREAARVWDHPDDRDSRRLVIQEVSLARLSLSRRNAV